MKKFTILLVVCLFLIINYTNSQTWTNYTTADGLAYNWVGAIAIDANGNKWFGTGQFGNSEEAGGVSKFDGTNWTTYTTTNGLANNNVYAIAIDATGNKWFGTAYGISKFDGANWTNYPLDPPEGKANYVPAIYVRAIVIETNSNIWIARYIQSSYIFYQLIPDGVSKFDGTNWTPYGIFNGLGSMEVHSIAIDAQGNKWFGTSGGVSRFDPITWPSYTISALYTTADGLVNNQVHTIAIDAQGNKWLGTNGGVSKFDGTNWITYVAANGLASNNIWAIAIDAQGNKWFGTSGGVSKFDGTTWTTYTTADGLVNNFVHAIAIDAQGNKWFGTSGGVSKLSDASTEITTINENHLNLYPNPVQDVLNIKLSGKTGEMQVFDISGKCLLKKQITENESSVDVSGLENGIYFVRVMHDKQIFTKKIVKY